MIRESTTKIEHRTVNALERIIDDHLTMDHHFNQDDKGVSWDGYISLFFNNTGDQSKHNLEGRVPVQIKGHQDRAHKYINKAVIRYAVSIEDLRLYGTEKGVLYFQIFTDGKAASIFYASLYPSRISDYLERASRRKEKPSRKRGSINIPFQSLKADPDNLYIIAKQFFDEGTQQGSTFNPLVKDRIRCDDFDRRIDHIIMQTAEEKNPSPSIFLCAESAAQRYPGITAVRGTIHIMRASCDFGCSNSMALNGDIISATERAHKFARTM